MPRIRTNTLGSYFLPVWLLLLLSTPVAAEVPVPMHMEYQASKLFVTVTTRVSLSRLSAQEAANQLLWPEGTAAPGGLPDSIILQTLSTGFLNRNVDTQAWMRPDGSLLQLSSLNSGTKLRYRRYNYLESVVTSIKRYPANPAEESLPWQDWSDTQSDRYPLPAGKDGSQSIEAETLFYQVALADWHNPPTVQERLLFDPDGLIRLQLEDRGLTELLVDYRLSENGETRRVSERVSCRRVGLNARPDDPANKAEFDFLGYKEGVEMCVDPDQGIILQLAGQYDYLGEVVIRLKSLDYAP